MTQARTVILILVLSGLARALPAAADSGRPARLDPAETVSGYLARLMINETPFPGERGWLSEENTRGAMLSILWVLDSRISHIPPGYSQEQVAAVRTDDIIDVITAGGERGQCDGFYRDSSGRFVFVDRVGERVESLLKIAGQGKPGRFARLLNYAQGLAAAYQKGGIREADRFAELNRVGSTPVTGRAYSWMADRDYYNPGGNFIRIPDADDGSLGGNRFFTLKKL